MFNLITSYSLLLPVLIGLITTSAADNDALAAPEKIDAPSLLGKDNRPQSGDINEIYKGPLGYAMGDFPQSDLLDKLNLVLLALTKLTDGDWIKSSFQEVEQDNRGLKSATVVFAKIDPTTRDPRDLVWELVKVEPANLERVSEILGAGTPKATQEDPWWSWAFAETALKIAGEVSADSILTDNADTAEVLEAVTGTRSWQALVPQDVKDAETMWTKYIAKANESPIILQFKKNEAGGSLQFVAMNFSGEGDKRVIECARLSREANNGGIKTSFLPLKSLFELVETIYFTEDFATFTSGRKKLKAA